MIIRIYLTKKFSKNVCDPFVIVVKYERWCMKVIDFSGEHSHGPHSFQGFEREDSISSYCHHSLLLCCSLLAISTQSSITRYVKGSNPHNIPWACLPPFNFTDNFLSISFFKWGGRALLMLSTWWAQSCLSKLFLLCFGYIVCYIITDGFEILCVKKKKGNRFKIQRSFFPPSFHLNILKTRV